MGSNSPVPIGSRLPPEVLAQIFCLCPHEESIFDLLSTVWTLGRVCSIWRAVSIDTPRLWTDISLRLDLLSDRTEEGSISMLRCALNRSAGLPLHIHLITPEWDMQPFFQQLVDLTREQSHRWVTFKFDDMTYSNRDNAPDVYPNEDSLKQAPPLLREFELKVGHPTRMSRDGDLRLYQSIRLSPLITKLVLNGISEMYNTLPTDPELPWHQYTHLEILDEEFTTPTEWLRKVLSKSTRLETLVLYPCQWEEPPEPLVHETLRTLEFRPNVKNKAYQILDLSWLTLPALEHLVLVDVDLEREMDSVIQMVEQSYCQLRSISVRGIMLTDITVARFLRAAGANAVNLTLEGQLFDHLFDCIASDETFLPKLEDLVVRLDKHTVLSPPIDALTAMVRARTQGTARVLRRVDVEVYSDPDEDEEEEEEEEEEGEGDDDDGNENENEGAEREDEEISTKGAGSAGIEAEDQEEPELEDGEDAEESEDELDPVKELEALGSNKLHIQVEHVQTEWYDGTEANQIRRFGMLLKSAMFKDHWLPGLVNLRENLPILDEIFTIIENCSPELYEDPDRQYTLRLATLRYALERFVREAGRLPTEYNLPERAEKLLDEKFGWNPNGRKRSLAEMKTRVAAGGNADD
ncbi:hypothetical protein V5O48_011538 [Marasmius crinis-equi]|uniref:F-box domain-containing protein n=1 Tax=Marasmius crinis-equi TaxID=585013 RepID=A0ABR3F5D4_9AGAR